jgi:hypothetical protein
MMNYDVLIPSRAAGYVIKDGVHLNYPSQDPVVEFADGGLISHLSYFFRLNTVMNL